MTVYTISTIQNFFRTLLHSSVLAREMSSSTQLPDIKRHASVDRTTSSIRNDGIKPSISLVAGLKENLHIRRMTLFRHHDIGAVTSLEHIDGVRTEGAFSVGQAPVEAGTDGALKYPR